MDSVPFTQDFGRKPAEYHEQSYYTTKGPYHNSVIIDNASDWHISNQRERMLSMHPWKNPRPILTGDHNTECKFIGDAWVILDTREEKKKQVRCPIHPEVSHPRLISAGLLRKDNNVFVNDRKHTLESKDGQTLAYLKEEGNMFLLEDGTETAINSATETRKTQKVSAQPPITKGTFETWHKRFGHISEHAIKHLDKTSTGAEISDVKPKTKGGEPSPLCQTCELSKAKQQISRRTRPQDQSKPFSVIHIDLILPSMQAYNGHKYLFHAWCEITKMHLAQSEFSKTILARGFMSVVNFIQNQFASPINGIKIRGIHGDQDSVTGSRDFAHFLSEKGIRFTPSAPYSPQQNRSIERAGGIITQFARSIHVDSGLLQNLWPELFLTAVHILNLMPTKSLGWESPMYKTYKIMGKQLPPDVSHLRIIGSKAYVRDATVPKGQKLQPRAKVGWLTGFEATNIWRVWIPDLKRIIRTRDVKFD